MKAFTIMLVDDHEVVRSGYRNFIESDAQLLVIAEADSANQAYTSLLNLESEGRLPDLVVVDVSLGDRSGLELIDRCVKRHPGLRMLVFSMHEDLRLVQHALDAGALGYVSKSSRPETVLEAIAAIRQGQTFLDPALQRRRQARLDQQSLIDQLSRRELEVLSQLLRGVDAQDIAETLSLSPKTIANHLSSIRGKLKVNNDFQLMRMLLELELPRL
jgi:two-component system, NarL family, invasion response regulator UvrY